MRLLQPKSHSFAFESTDSRMLEGFKSRWMIWWEWRKAISTTHFDSEHYLRLWSELAGSCSTLGYEEWRMKENIARIPKRCCSRWSFRLHRLVLCRSGLRNKQESFIPIILAKKCLESSSEWSIRYWLRKSSREEWISPFSKRIIKMNHWIYPQYRIRLHVSALEHRSFRFYHHAQGRRFQLNWIEFGYLHVPLPTFLSTI